MGKRLSLSDQVRRAIDTAGVSRYRICMETGIDQSSMSRFMNGQTGLTTTALDALAEFLDLHLAAGPRRGPKKEG